MINRVAIEAEEMRASKRHSSELQKKVLSYVVGSCALDTDDESNLNQKKVNAKLSLKVKYDWFD